MYSLMIVIFVICLIYHTYTDLKETLLYDWVNVVILALGIVYAYINASLLDSMYGFGMGLVIMLIIYLASKGGLGEGDVKLVPCLGIWLGLDKTLLTLFLAFVFGAIVGLAAIAFEGKKLKTAIPFGPFLCCSALLSYFYGNKIIMLYFNYVLHNS